MKKLSRRLLIKSQDAFLLSLEVYNKPTIKYRLESFCFFFTNAWELLLKAKIIEKKKDVRAIFYKKSRNDKKKSISLKDTLKKIFPNDQDPIRKNIEDIEKLRDSATHLIIDELDIVYMGLFQAGVLNYVNLLKEWFNIDIIKKTSPAMLSLMFDLGEINTTILKKRYNKEIISFFLQKQKEIFDNTVDLKDKRYSISIEYKVALVKNPKEADIVLSTGQEGGIRGVLIEVPKDPASTHPYRSIDCISSVQEQIGKEIIFNQYDLQAIMFKEKIRGNSKYHYFFKTTGANTYSKELIDFIVRKIKDNPEYLKKARESFGKYNHDKFLERKKKNGKPAKS